jgi:hypothetical protein
MGKSGVLSRFSGLSVLVRAKKRPKIACFVRITPSDVRIHPSDVGRPPCFVGMRTHMMTDNFRGECTNAERSTVLHYRAAQVSKPQKVETKVRREEGSEQDLGILGFKDGEWESGH